MAELLTQKQLDQIKVDNDARMASFANKKDTPDTTNNTDFMSELQSRLLGMTDIVSSGNTGVEDAIKSAQESTAKAQEFGASRIESRFGEKITDIKEAGATALTSAREAQRGFGVNSAALRQLNQDTDKKVKEYERMEQDALMSNNLQFASQISQLKIQELQFNQQATQQSFSNMLQVAGLGLQVRAEDRAADQFRQNLTLQRDQIESTKQNNMLGMATDAGISLNPGETYESLSKRIANSEMTTLKKQKLKSQISDLQGEDESNQFDMYANAVVSSELENGKTAVQAAKKAIFELTEIFGGKVSLEQRNKIMGSALLLEQQMKDSINKQMNDTSNAQSIYEQVLSNLPDLAFDSPIRSLPGFKPRQDTTGLDLSTADFSKGLNIPSKEKERDELKTGEDIYSSLFGEV